MSTARDSVIPDFSTRLHELRSSELRRVPGDARVVLHGGAAGAWYFDWFEKNYVGPVDRHVGVEAFAERPDDLPPNVQWVQSTLGNMRPVPTASVDMVFAGQVIEHLWADDITDFLVESHRVLRPHGLLVLDSPNRRITEAIRWHHPEHTSELSVDEISRLLGLAGFEPQELRGVLLGYDREHQTFLGLEDERMSWEDRARLAPERPEDSFVWWLTARRGGVTPDVKALRELAGLQADAFRSHRLQRLSTPLRVERGGGHVPYVSANDGYAGPLLYGPDFPLDRGDWRTSVVLRLESPNVDASLPVARVDVTSGAGTVVHAHRDVFARDLDSGTAWTDIELSFELSEMVMGLQVRGFALGNAGVGAQLVIGLRRADDMPVSSTSVKSQGAEHLPEPRTVEIIAMLRRRALAKARRALDNSRAAARSRP